MTKYQVFVSSTYEDLKPERDAAIKAILDMGHIPVGMEMFSAADDEQWKIIARHIAESDYYCVILGRKVGSLTSEEISYTRKEYEFAVSESVPALGFVLSDDAPRTASQVESSSLNNRLLDDFRDLVKQKPVKFFSSPEQLSLYVTQALSNAIASNPRAGWVRADDSSEANASREAIRLSAENSRLREEIQRLKSESEVGAIEAVERAMAKLSNLSMTMSYKYSSGDQEWSLRSVTYKSAFNVLAPQLVVESEIATLSRDLAMHIREDQSRPWWTVAINQVRSMLADWSVLNLLEPSTKKHAVSDKGEYWQLTEFGRQVFSHTRLVALGGNMNREMEKLEEPAIDEEDAAFDQILYEP